MEYFYNFNYNRFLELIIIICGTIVVAQVVTFFLVFISKHIAKRTKTHVDDEIIDSFRNPVFYTIVLSGVYFLLRTLFFGDVIFDVTLPLFRTTLILIWALFFTKLVKILLYFFRDIEKVKFVTMQTIPLFTNMSVVLIWTIALYVVFVVWNIDMTAWLASAGVAGIAIGFAAKDTLANLISGMFILTDAPFKIGDYILLDNGSRGKVTNIGMRTTRIRTMDDTEVTIPNAVIGNATLTNESGGEAGKVFRVKVPFGVAYGTDVDQVEKIVYDIAIKNENVLTEPEPRIRFRLFGASSLDFELLVWVKSSSKKGIAIHTLNHAIYKEFNKHNIEIPYTKQDLYIKELPHRLHKQ
ncbi:MAG: mechanosensitive ion channel protein [Candidatus Moraniibacteriota bacterium]|nr:MAG: mechanosensitive ion channel protein [Candidatus Moranbacteria bacterium]